jgi:hypothetical protein
MSAREDARTAIAMLRERGWSKGSAIDGEGRVCMAVALNDGEVKVTPEGFWRNGATWYTVLRLIAEMYPGRVKHLTVADFNDHPDTTLEDIMLVLKHMAEEGDS